MHIQCIPYKVVSVNIIYIVCIGLYSGLVQSVYNIQCILKGSVQCTLICTFTVHGFYLYKLSLNSLLHREGTVYNIFKLLKDDIVLYVVQGILFQLAKMSFVKQITFQPTKDANSTTMWSPLFLKIKLL